MSSLPTVDDLQKRARANGPGLTLDLRSHTGEHRRPLLVTPESTLQHQQETTSCAAGLFRNCTTAFQCSRFKPDLPSYKPLHRQMAPPPTTKVPSPWRSWSDHGRFCFLLASVLFSTLAFWSGMVFWNVLTTWSERMHRSSPSSTGSALNHEGQWYGEATFYEIFPASFLDTDSDGYGDFQGIVRKLDYIRDLGVTAIRLNSIFSALDYPLEYEHVIDLHSADPHLGKANDFRQLVREAHARGLRVVLDLNPTLTSDQHTWALHWQRGIPGYEHFYASANRSKAPPEMENSEGPPPEDWELTQRTFGGHYLLNWSNPLVQDEYRRTLEYWMDTGVDGFYMKHLEKMHVLTPEDIPSIVRGWRRTLDRPRSEWTLDRTSRNVLIVSSRFADHLAVELGHTASWSDVLRSVDLLDCPILVGSGQEMAEQVSGLRRVSGWPAGFPVPVWHLGSSDTFRLASRIEPRYQEAALFLLMALPGANSAFYGDEIGLRDSYDTFNGRVYRAGQLTPMQWTSDNSSGGFTDNTTQPWMPLNPDHLFINVDSRRNQLRDFARLLRFRRNTLKGYSPRDQRVSVLDPNVLVLERSRGRPERKRILLAANFGSVSEEKEFPDSYGKVRVLVTTSKPTRTRVRSRSFTLSPGAAFLAEVSLLDNTAPSVMRKG